MTDPCNAQNNNFYNSIMFCYSVFKDTCGLFPRKPHHIRHGDPTFAYILYIVAILAISITILLSEIKVILNHFTAITAIWRFEVITHAAICLTLADKCFKRLNTQCAHSENGTPIGSRLLG